MLSSLIPSAFPALVLAHFLALISPGQDFLIISSHAIRYRVLGCWFICLGIAMGNAVYIAIAIVGWTSIQDNPAIFTLVELLGASYLLWIGKGLISSRRLGDLQHKLIQQPSIAKQFLIGMNSALLNPKNALFYMTLMTVILGKDVSLIQQVVSGVWMFFAVLFWDLLIACVIGYRHVQSVLYGYLHFIEKGAGIVLILFALALIARYMLRLFSIS